MFEMMKIAKKLKNTAGEGLITLFLTAIPSVWRTEDLIDFA